MRFFGEIVHFFLKEHVVYYNKYLLIKEEWHKKDGRPARSVRMSQKKKNPAERSAAPRKKKWLSIVMTVLVSLAVWSGACYFCYAYGMNQEKNRLLEMLDPALAEQADSLKWVTAVDEPMTDDQLKERTKVVLGNIEFQVKCFGRKTNADGTPFLDENGHNAHITYESALQQGLFQEPDTAEMQVSTTSDPERGWELRVVETPQGNVTYRSKDESVTRIRRFYTSDSETAAPVRTATQAVERANAYYTWGLPFPTGYEMSGVEKSDDQWVVTYQRAVRLKDLPKLHSQGQTVQVIISAEDGEMISADCLDLMLVQVGTDQKSISQEEAVKAAEKSLEEGGITGAVFQGAEYAIAEPNFIFTPKEGGYAYDPETHLTRAVWNVRFLCGDQKKLISNVYIDAYTGQPLGGLSHEE